MRSRSPPLDAAVARERIRSLTEHPAARALLLAAAPERVLLVGGAPRDAALGRPVGDLDAVVARNGEQIADRLAAALGGRAIRLAPGRFAALRVAAPELAIDVWDLEGSNLADDLARRDLTVNALALDLATGRVLDPHGGLADLAAHRLRAVRRATFAADPLRVLRLARLAVSLGGFEIQAGTARAARAAAPGLGRVAGERIREELVQLAGAASPAEEQRALEHVGAFPGLWDSFTVGSPAASRSAAELLERYATARASLGGPHALAGELAARHALRLRSAPSELSTYSRLEKLARRAIVTRAEARLVAALLGLEVAAPPQGEQRLLELARHGGHWQAALAVSAATAPAGTRRAWRRYLAESRAAVEARGPALLAPRPLVDGAEVQQLLGLEEGPEVGRALSALVEAQILGRVTGVAGARRFLREWRRRRVDG